MKIDGTDSVGFDFNSVRKDVSVQAPQAVACRVFTEKMGTWWPLASYKIGKDNAVDAVIEPQSGAAGTSAAMMEASVGGAAYSHGNRPRAWYSRGYRHRLARVELAHRVLIATGLRRDKVVSNLQYQRRLGLALGGHLTMPQPSQRQHVGY